MISLNNQKLPIIVIGPAIDGQGGISRVIRLWQQGNIFKSCKISFIPSASDDTRNSLLFLFKNLFLFLRLTLQNKSLIYIHTSSYKSFYRKSLFMVPAIYLQRQVILHIHPSHFYDFYSNLRGLPRFYVNFLLKKVSGFVFLTHEMKNKFQNIFPDTPMWVLRNPIDVNSMKNHGDYTRKDDQLLFLGWFIRAKGIFELVDAVALLIEKGYKIKLNFYGTKEINKLKTYISNRHLDEFVVVHGWINTDQKIRVLYESTMLILPSHSEGIPNVILEAMATRTPIVSTLVGGLKEILRHEINAIIIKKNNAIDLADKISMLLDDKALRNRIANNAFKDVSSLYDISVIKSNFFEIIRQIPQ